MISSKLEHPNNFHSVLEVHTMLKAETIGANHVLMVCTDLD